MNKVEFSEKDFRLKVNDFFKAVERALDQVDPDLIEFELSQGSVTLTFQDRSKCILSVQPSVRQIWMAVAMKGIAYHFNYAETDGRWRDDKTGNVELLSFLEKLLSEQAGVAVALSG